LQLLSTAVPLYDALDEKSQRLHDDLAKEYLLNAKVQDALLEKDKALADKDKALAEQASQIYQLNGLCKASNKKLDASNRTKLFYMNVILPLFSLSYPHPSVSSSASIPTQIH
jgi:hypothetical protein